MAKDSGIGMILLGAGLLYFLSKKNGTYPSDTIERGRNGFGAGGAGARGDAGDGDAPEERIATKITVSKIEAQRPRTPSQISYENFRLGKPVKVKTGIYEIR